jgi:aspartate racemase
MEQNFYKARITERLGHEVLVPDDAGSVEGALGDLQGTRPGGAEPSSRQAYRAVIARLVARGAEAVMLSCAEIMLPVKPEDRAGPLFYTTTSTPG